MELNKSSPADRPQRLTGLLVIALGMTAVLSWYAGDDLLFALRAERVQAKVSGWSVTMTFGRVDPPQAIAAARTGVAPVPRVDLTLPGPDARRCIAQGRRAVFGMREIESEQQMKHAVLQVPRQQRQQEFDPAAPASMKATSWQPPLHPSN